MKTYKHEEIREHNEFSIIGVVGTWVVSLTVVAAMLIQTIM